jgi:hypothetical protein
MKKKKNKESSITLEDYIKAGRKGNREAEMELLGPGFHSKNRIHKSKKNYTRKEKHKDRVDNLYGKNNY